MDGPGTVTWEEFLENAENFVVASNKIADKWELHGDKSAPGQAYLVRQSKSFGSKMKNFKSDGWPPVEDEWIETVGSRMREDAFEGSSIVQVPLTTEHHVLWSMSYSVPVLYFNGWKSDFPGVNRMSVEEAQEMISDFEVGYRELSQGIHPILGIPFLHLHPCMTHELLEIMSKSKNKLVSWLSSIAPAALHLELRPEYYQLTIQGQPRNSS